MRNRCPHHAGQRLLPLQTPPQARGCETCHGIWLPGDVVELALGYRPGAEIGHLVERALRCPDDGEPLRALHHEGIEIDVCGACGGLWLDGGELEAILEARNSDPADVDGDSAADVVESWFDAANRRGGKPAGDGADQAPGTGGGRVVGAKPDAPAPSSSWQLERADPLPARAGGNAIDVSHAVVNSPSGGASAAADGGLLESLGDAVGGVFGFIGDAFSGL